MTNSFWFSTTGEVVRVPAQEPPYDIEESARFDGEDNKLTRTPQDTDGQRIGETGTIEAVAYNEDGTVTLTVADGLEPHQDLQGDYLQVGDTLTQDSAGSISTSDITTASIPYVIGDSVIFDGSSSYLTRTPSVASNRKTWTWSGWVKRSALGSQKVFIAGTSGIEGGLQFHSGTDDMAIRFYDFQDGAHTFQLDTSQLFRDTNSWIHIVASVNTVHETTSERAKLYINGEEVTSFTTATYPQQNLDTLVNSSTDHYLGVVPPSGNYFNGYLADVQFVDGLALEASAFGEYNSDGVWVPKAADLTRLSPYDTRPNADQDWSSLATLESGSTWNSSYPLANMFDGSLSTEGGLTYVGGQSGTLNFTGLGTISKLRLHCALSGQNSHGVINGSIIINGIDITDGGNNSIWAQAGGGNDSAWVELPVDSIGNQLNSIQLTVTGGGQNTPYIKAIEVDNRILVDGPWDNSQNWSDDVTSDTSVLNAPNGFDGDIGTTINGNGNGSGLTFTPSTPIAYTTSVRVYTSSAGSLSLNGGTSVGTGGVGQYYTLATGSGTITSIVMQGGGDSGSWAAIEVDGKILTDGGAAWNTTETWSAGNGTSALFDGDESTYRQLSSFPRTVSSKELTVNSSVRILSNDGDGINSGVRLGGVDYYVNNTSTGSPVIWREVDLSGATLPLTVSGFDIIYTGSSNNFYAIEVDGEVLVDGGYGANGYHLDFSSTNLGEDSSGLDNDWTAVSLPSSTKTIDSPIGFINADGDVVGNYATWNPLETLNSPTLSNGNLNLTAGGTIDWQGAFSTLSVGSGKWYFETTCSKVNTGSGSGNAGAAISIRTKDGTGSNTNDDYTFRYTDVGYVKNGNSSDGQVSVSGNAELGDVIGIAFDADLGTYNLYINGSEVSSGSFSFLNYTPGDELRVYTAAYPDNNGYVYGNLSNVNFGQKPWAHTPPAGYKSLCLTNF